jgi:methanethiol oxidase
LPGPNAYEKGFDIADVGAGATGSGCHFWDLAERRLEQTIDLGARGLIPLEVRWLHDPDAEGGFVGFPRAVRAVPWNMLLEGAAPSR